MELVELPSRTELEQENDPATHTQTQTQDGPLATGIKKRGLFVSTILKQGADFFTFTQQLQDLKHIWSDPAWILS